MTRALATKIRQARPVYHESDSRPVPGLTPFDRRPASPLTWWNRQTVEWGVCAAIVMAATGMVALVFGNAIGRMLG